MVTYQVALDSIALQTLKITAQIPNHSENLVLTLPAWIPGSYMIRDFAKNIGQFSATDTQGRPLNWQKTDKQTWFIETKGESCIISYCVVANDYSVRSAFISDEYAFFNGTSVFLQVKDHEQLEYSVTLDSVSCPESWKAYTRLPKNSCRYVTLIDNPIYWGVAQTTLFVVDGVEFTFLLSGNQPIDIERICRDVTPICQHHLNLFEKPYPIDQYLFITLLADSGYGGLEHRESTVLMYPRFDLPLRGESEKKTDEYIDFLSLCSHELFHTWHVKRIRPDVLLQPDLSKEVYTSQLWIYEGFTSFYDDLAVVRAGQMTPEHYCKLVGQNVTQLLHANGRLKQSIAESSFDAWTRFYKQDAHSNNHIVSYYTKGGIVAMALDIELRQRSNNTVSLDEVMKRLWQSHGINETGTNDSAIQMICADLGIDVSEFIEKSVYQHNELDLHAVFSSIGLSLHTRPRINANDKGGTAPNGMIGCDLGATLKDNPTIGCNIVQLQQGSAAEEAGLQIGDQVVAVNNWLANEKLWLRILNQSSVGETLQLSVARQGRLISLLMPVKESVDRVAYLTIDDKATFYAWLGLDQ